MKRARAPHSGYRWLLAILGLFLLAWLLWLETVYFTFHGHP